LTQKLLKLASKSALIFKNEIQTSKERINMIKTLWETSVRPSFGRCWAKRVWKRWSSTANTTMYHQRSS